MLKRDGKHMNAESFAYWLQGYFEISGSSTLSDTQVQIIKDHLGLVFNKVTPNYTLAMGKVPVGDIEYFGTIPVKIPSQESWGSTVYTDNHPLVEVSIPHSC